MRRPKVNRRTIGLGYPLSFYKVFQAGKTTVPEHAVMIEPGIDGCQAASGVSMPWGCERLIYLIHLQRIKARG